MAVLDLQKAFHIVNQKILLKKLEVIGLDSSCIKWFRSYLTNRHQVVTMQKVILDSLPIKCGVPQGSILGPILFMCYINDVCICVNNSKLLLYADDSVLLYYSDTNPKIDWRKSQYIFKYPNAFWKKERKKFNKELLRFRAHANMACIMRMSSARHFIFV